MFDEPEFLGSGGLPGEPTDALPGTERKIQIMTERATRHEQLFHPQDGLRKVVRKSQRPSAGLSAWMPEATAAPRRPVEAAEIGAAG